MRIWLGLDKRYWRTSRKAAGVVMLDLGVLYCYGTQFLTILVFCGCSPPLFVFFFRVSFSSCWSVSFSARAGCCGAERSGADSELITPTGLKFYDWWWISPVDGYWIRWVFFLISQWVPKTSRCSSGYKTKPSRNTLNSLLLYLDQTNSRFMSIICLGITLYVTLAFSFFLRFATWYDLGPSISSLLICCYLIRYGLKVDGIWAWPMESIPVIIPCNLLNSCEAEFLE